MRILLLLGLMMLPLHAQPAFAAAECTLTPLELPLFGATPLAKLATPVATPGAVSITQDETEAVLETYVACTNTGDPTLIWAIFTPRWFATEFADSEEHYLPAFEYDIANGNDPVGDPLVLESIEAIELLPDGRVAVEASFSSGSLAWTDRLLLAYIDDQWLIDEVELVSPLD